LFVNQYYLPDGAPTARILGDVAGSLAGRGLGVRVVCGAGRYAEALEGDGVAGVEVVRVGSGSKGRVAGYLSFYVRAAGAVLFGPKSDVVVTMTTPPGLGVLGWMAQRVRGARHVIWEMDVYPDVAEALGAVARGGWLARAAGAVMDAARRRADAVVVLGRCMADRVAARGVARARIHICENWADGEGVAPEAFHGEAALRVLYAGNLGLAHDVETVIEGMRRLGAGFEFVFNGGGPRRGWMERACREMPWVRFQGYQPREELRGLMNWGDVGLVTQRRETLGAVVPSKAYAVMAAGRGVVYVGPGESELGRMIDEHGVGWRVANGDAAGFAAMMERLRARREEARETGARARALFEARYERRRGVARLSKVLTGCIQSAS
jgi:colanic acid biosynthesis glycosyl transferase WcaI